MGQELVRFRLILQFWKMGSSHAGLILGIRLGYKFRRFTFFRKAIMTIIQYKNHVQMLRFQRRNKSAIKITCIAMYKRNRLQSIFLTQI